MGQKVIKEKTKQKIIKDYKNGLGVVRLSKKYHASQSGINYILHANGVEKRSASEALKVRRQNGLKKWRFINRRNGSGSRLVNVPSVLFERLGYCSGDMLLGRWTILDGRLFLELRKVES
ncbi:MAG: hypothetical protein WC325_11840 [Candidatus Bathyarchaeia archaeon]